jgi:hypothetical protein
MVDQIFKTMVLLIDLVIYPRLCKVIVGRSVKNPKSKQACQGTWRLVDPEYPDTEKQNCELVNHVACKLGHEC